MGSQEILTKKTRNSCFLYGVKGNPDHNNSQFVFKKFRIPQSSMKKIVEILSLMSKKSWKSGPVGEKKSRNSLASHGNPNKKGCEFSGNPDGYW